MRCKCEWLAKEAIAGLLVLVLAANLGQAASAQSEQEDSRGSSSSHESDSAVQTAARPQDAERDVAATLPQDPGQQQEGGAKPVGTAAAPYEKPAGVAASRPAGAVIAPAKQRRARSIFIKVGVIVGAGVAVGTVVALSHSSSSRP